jgi:hypothetical protein
MIVHRDTVENQTTVEEIVLIIVVRTMAGTIVRTTEEGIVVRTTEEGIVRTTEEGIVRTMEEGIVAEVVETTVEIAIVTQIIQHQETGIKIGNIFIYSYDNLK